MTLNITSSKLSHECSTRIPESPISLRFAFRLAISKILEFLFHFLIDHDVKFQPFSNLKENKFQNFQAATFIWTVKRNTYKRFV